MNVNDDDGDYLINHLWEFHQM